MADVLRRHKRNGSKSPPHPSRGRLYPQGMKKKIDKSLEEIEKRTQTPASKAARENIAAAISLGIPAARVISLGTKMISGAPAAMASARATFKALIGATKKTPSGAKVVKYPAPVGKGTASTVLSKANIRDAANIRNTVATGVVGAAAIKGMGKDKDAKVAPVPKPRPKRPPVKSATPPTPSAPKVTKAPIVVEKRQKIIAAPAPKAATKVAKDKVAPRPKPRPNRSTVESATPPTPSAPKVTKAPIVAEKRPKIIAAPAPKAAPKVAKDKVETIGEYFSDMKGRKTKVKTPFGTLDVDSSDSAYPEPDQYKAGGKVSMGRGMGKALRGGGKVMR